MCHIMQQEGMPRTAFPPAFERLIRSFVLKFEKLGLLQSARYGNRVKYAVRMS